MPSAPLHLGLAGSEGDFGSHSDVAMAQIINPKMDGFPTLLNMIISVGYWYHNFEPTPFIGSKNGKSWQEIPGRSPESGSGESEST